VGRECVTLALSVFLLAGGRLTDLFGGRRVLLFGLVLYIRASLVAGLAHSAWLLLVGRTLQGIAGALVLPATLALVAATFRSGGRGLALGMWAGAGAAALAIGPLAGALVTERPGWAWIFLANVPLGAVSLIAVRAALPAAGPRRVLSGELVTDDDRRPLRGVRSRLITAPANRGAGPAMLGGANRYIVGVKPTAR
jgi:MFS family permease